MPNRSESNRSETGYETLECEWPFNERPGFAEADGEPPQLFYVQPQATTGKAVRHHTAEVNRHVRKVLEEHRAG